MHYDFERLKLLSARSTSLPPLPASVFRLMELTEKGGYSAGQIAAITSADPMLCANLLRAANSTWDFAGMARITSVQAAVMRLGMNTVRSMAISLGVQAMFTARLAGCLFDPLCYARHSIMVGLLGRYIFARSLMISPVQTALKPEEVFAAGVLHDLPVALLAWIAPDAYDHVHAHCKAMALPIERGFKDLYTGSIRELGTQAIKTWGLPEAFGSIIRFADEPTAAPSEQMPIMAINMASAVADSKGAETNGFASAPWSCRVAIAPEVKEAMGIEQEELDRVFETILPQIEMYLPSKIMTKPVYIKGRRIA